MMSKRFIRKTICSITVVLASCFYSHAAIEASGDTLSNWQVFYNDLFVGDYTDQCSIDEVTFSARTAYVGDTLVFKYSADDDMAATQFTVEDGKHHIIQQTELDESVALVKISVLDLLNTGRTYFELWLNRSLSSGQYQKQRAFQFYILPDGAHLA